MASMLSKNYNVPLINITEVLDDWLTNEYEVKGLDPDNDPYADHRETVQKYKEELEQFNSQQQDKKKKDKKNLSEKPLLPDEIVCLAYKWKLNSNSCLNRGFILDN